MMTDVAQYPVFRDDHGNRLIFPGLYSYRDRRADWSYCRLVCVTLNLTEEKFKFLATPEDDGSLCFPHVVADAHHPGFAHGGGEVWLIGGPTFDEISALPAPPELS